MLVGSGKFSEAFKSWPLMIEEIWRPDSFFKNAKAVTFQRMTIPNHYLWLYRSKKIMYMVKWVFLYNLAFLILWKGSSSFWTSPVLSALIFQFYKAIISHCPLIRDFLAPKILLPDSNKSLIITQIIRTWVVDNALQRNLNRMLVVRRNNTINPVEKFCNSF